MRKAQKKEEKALVWEKAGKEHRLGTLQEAENDATLAVMLTS